MAARGSIAKKNVEEKLMKIFGEDFIGIYDKKIYVRADDGGEKVQIAISLTCPKNPVGAAPLEDYDFEAMSAEPPKPQTEITEDEKQNIADLMARLGL